MRRGVYVPDSRRELQMHIHFGDQESLVSEKLWTSVHISFFGEFDSGSERTLAAWIRHAS